MSELLPIFSNNLLPIFLASGAGYLLGKRLNINPRPISQLTFYIFSPCLVFNLLTHNQLGNDDILRMVTITALLVGIIGLLTWGAARLMKLERRLLVAVLITSMFMNAGNYGLPVTLFAFGDTALSYASIFFVTNAILVYSVGVLIASSGSQGITQSLKGLFKLPATYSLILAILFINQGWQLPTMLNRTVTTLGDAAVPAMLVILGLQFTNSRWTTHRLPLSLASAMRLLVAPLLALVLSRAFGLAPPAHQATVLEAAMPAAVLNTILAIEFDVEPSFVTTVVFTTTILSPITLTPLLAFLGA